MLFQAPIPILDLNIGQVEITHDIREQTPEQFVCLDADHASFMIENFQFEDNSDYDNEDNGDTVAITPECLLYLAIIGERIDAPAPRVALLKYPISPCTDSSSHMAPAVS
jgi:hypothetical protein